MFLDDVVKVGWLFGEVVFWGKILCVVDVWLGVGLVIFGLFMIGVMLLF